MIQLMYHYENPNSPRAGLNIDKNDHTGPPDVKCLII